MPTSSRKLLCAAVGALVLPAAAAHAASTYIASLVEQNNSGVSGTATVTLDGDQLSVHVVASGLEPDKMPPQHIHGFVDNSKPFRLPGPEFDVNKNGMIDDAEGELAVGPAILPLVPAPPDPDTHPYDFPTVGSDGKLDFREVYDLKPDEKDLLEPLNLRGVELHGLTVDGDYVVELPVAGGRLELSGGSDDGGGQAIPLPPAIVPGAFLLGSIGISRCLRRRRLA